MDQTESKTEATRPVLIPNVQRREPKSGCCNVLFLCPDNSAVSILAETLLNRWGGTEFRGFSAGSNPAPCVNPLAIDVLKTNRLARTDLQPKSCQQFLAQDAPRMRFVISLGDHKPDGLPSMWPGNPKVVHWRISEPIVDGTPADKKLAIRKTFVELETRVKLFVLVNNRPTSRQAAA
jgi:arsenate reductase (thioredoxin)